MTARVYIVVLIAILFSLGALVHAQILVRGCDRLAVERYVACRSSCQSKNETACFNKCFRRLRAELKVCEVRGRKR